MLNQKYFLALGLSTVLSGLVGCTVTTTPTATTPSAKPTEAAKTEAPKADAPKPDAGAKPTESPKADAKPDAKDAKPAATGTKAGGLKVAPKATAQSLANNPEFDKIAADVAKSIGFTDYAYEAYALPPTDKWEDTLAYYDGEMKKAGWSGEGTITDIDGGKVGAFVNKETKSGIVIFFIASPDGTKPAVNLAIFGS